MTTTDRQVYHFEQIINDENEALKNRRKKMADKGLYTAPADQFQETKFGIAMSGGGIRSATINLGFLKTLNIFKILQQADYLSTVSGGGYCGQYIQATLKERGDYQQLFAPEDISHLRSHGAYWIPGQGAAIKFWNTLVLTVGYFFSLMMTLLSPILTLISFVMLFRIVGGLLADLTGGVDITPEEGGMNFLTKSALITGVIALGVGVLHMVLNLLRKFRLRMSRRFNQAETFTVVVALTFLFVSMLLKVQVKPLNELMPAFHPILHELIPVSDTILSIIIATFCIVLGFFLNPNALSFHRFYRGQLAEAYLKKASKKENLRLYETFNIDGEAKTDWMNPYPLINTCLNLQNPGGGEAFKGAKASDYFLLSPKYCGAKLVDYVDTKTFPGYQQMTLPAATTISAAAVNPGMGIYSNKVLSVLMTIFNARLGFWVNNPIKAFRNTKYIVWWPFYFFYELFSKIGTNNRKLNISDGGHIENLAVYELLRRKCRLILAIDAGADPTFAFTDLENLTIRARNELGIAIVFKDKQAPEDIIRPKASHGYSQKRFAVADLLQIWEEFEVLDDAGKHFQYAIVDHSKKGKNPPIYKNVEALVNYSFDEKRQEVTYRIDLKIPATSNIKISDETRHEALQAAGKVAKEKLAKRKGEGEQKLKIGTMVYIKSSVTAPNGKPYIPRTDEGESWKFDTYKYKIYHPSFPHEPTSDQFFDPVQWESYYQLGQFMAGSVLGCKSSKLQYFRTCWEECRQEGQDAGIDEISIADLLARFEEDKNLFPEKVTPKAEVEASPAFEFESHTLEEEMNINMLEGDEEAAAPPVYEPESAKKKEETPPAAVPKASEEIGYEM